MKKLTQERINSLSLNDAKGYKAEAVEAARKLNAKIADPDFAATSERREELQNQLDETLTTAEACGTRIEHIEAQQAAAVARANGRDITGMPGGRSAGGAMRVADFKAMTPGSLDNGGFESISDFARSVFKQRHGLGADQRLVNFQASQTGSDNPSGGFLIPTQFAREVLKSDDAAEPWLDLVDRTILPPGFGKVSLPAIADRDRSGNTVGGLRLSRRAEGSTVVESTITLTRDEVSLDSAGTIVKVSQELMEDSIPGSVDEMLLNVFGSALTQTLSADIVGTATATVPGGIINSPACYEVAKESGQAAATINGTNILKMRERMKPSSLSRAVWLVSSDVYRQLVSAHTTLTSDDYPLFMHGNGSDVPDTMLGRPVYQTEACETLGTKGDIVLADLSKYRHIMRGPSIDSSPHIGFETNELVWRFMIRDYGTPKFNGTYRTMNNFEVAEFVALATRA